MRRTFRRYRSGEGLAGGIEFADTGEVDAESSSMERGRLEDSAIAEREEMEESSRLRGLGRLEMEDEDWEIGSEI